MILKDGIRLAALAALATAMGSCSLMHDDLAPCATQPKTRTAVSFVYDYNADSRDSFADEVGGVTLYVFDSEGKLIRSEEQTLLSGADGTRLPAAPVTLDLAPGDYDFYAVAHASSGYTASIEGTGAKFRRADGFGTGSAAADYIIRLDQTAGNVAHAGSTLEDLWMTLSPAHLTVTEAPIPAEGAAQPDDVVLGVTVPLMRVTNHLDLTLVREMAAPSAPRAASATRAGLDDPVDTRDYEVWIETGSGRDALGLTGDAHTSATPLRYTPYSVDPLTAQTDRMKALFSTSRIIYSADDTRADVLCVKSAITGTVNRINLGRTLSAAIPPSSDWTPQEFLDRTKDFQVTVAFNETDDGFRYIEINIPVLNWTKRIQNLDL
ncbi:MAG: FimB/Mfa2 family fimbrial subunit [Bacteroides sp.]|nr:FimB/Mfa2 family fimbrial subunit [Bacteroides sp.]